MKLSKEELAEALFHAHRETAGDESELYWNALGAIEDGTLEIEGYEQVTWHEFNPDDPKTWPDEGDRVIVSLENGAVCEVCVFPVTLPEAKRNRILMFTDRDDVVEPTQVTQWREKPKPPTKG